MQRSKPFEGELRFELLAEIAVGATARIELCRITEGARSGELVAVKRLHPHIAEDPQFVDMFRDEVWMTAALKHVHVVEVVGWGQDAEGPWLAVELVRGVSLQRLMKTVFETGERFTERMVVFLARSICDGLATAHSLRSADGEHLNLVHRDLTPGNILLGFDGQVKITDFGLAKAKQRLTKTLTGLLKGQPQYMSPEQVQGQPLDARSDVFALGVVVFELFSGRRPWTAQTDLEAMRAITDGAPADLQSLRPRIDRALVEIVTRCLEKAPGERFQSALELRDRFDQWLIAHGYRDDNHSSLARFVRRNAMRQMRWFERAVAGEFANKARSERLPLSLGPSVLSGGIPEPKPSAPSGRVRSATNPTAPATPGSRQVEAAREREPEGDIDWGEDGPTLIKRAHEAREAIARSRGGLPPPRVPEPSHEPSTLKQRIPKEVLALSRQTVGGGDSVAPRTNLSRRIADAATEAHEQRPHSESADDTVQLNEAQRQAIQRLESAEEFDASLLGKVAPPDPDVPPLPPELPGEQTIPLTGSPDATTRMRARVQPPPSPRRSERPPADSTITQARPPPESLIHAPPPAYPPERSNDYVAEANRLGEEARVAAEQAQHAADRAEATARAAALAAEAAMLAARGDHREAIQKLREAQLVDEVLKRGGMPARVPLGSEAASTGRLRAAADSWYAFMSSREGATVLVIAALGLILTVLLIVWLV